MRHAKPLAATDDTRWAACVREPRDWRVGDWLGMVRHRPTRTAFQLIVHSGMPMGGTHRLEDFGVRLVHTGQGGAVPAGAELCLLCSEAIFIALHQLGHLTLLGVHDDEESDTMTQF